jgi:ketosteroid isomerase-like protein
MPHPTALEKDLRAIEVLNRRDVEAVLAGNAAAAISQWTDDFVALPPAGPILRGRVANAAVVERGMEQRRAIEPVDYVVDFEEIKVLGEYAFEWGTYRGRMRPRAGGETLSYGGKLMRILQRQPDGAWKMYRTMITSDPPAG